MLPSNMLPKPVICIRCQGNCGWYESPESGEAYLSEPKDDRCWIWIVCPLCEGTGYTTEVEETSLGE